MLKLYLEKKKNTQIFQKIEKTKSELNVKLFKIRKLLCQKNGVKKRSPKCSVSHHESNAVEHKKIFIPT